MIGNWAKLEDFNLHYPIPIYKISSNTHVIEILQGCLRIGSEANPLTIPQSLQLKLLFHVQFYAISLYSNMT